MLYDRKAVQENLRNKDGQRVFYLGKGHQLTSDARDWLSTERIPILPGESAKPSQYRLLNGGVLSEKPEHMTHLNAEFLVNKTHPRIAFRGSMDSLEAALLLATAECQGNIRSQLEEALPIPGIFWGRRCWSSPSSVRHWGASMKNSCGNGLTGLRTSTESPILCQVLRMENLCFW